MTQLDQVEQGSAIRECWGGAKWTPDQARYWSPILIENGIDGVVTRLRQLAGVWTERIVKGESDFDLGKAAGQAIKAALRAAIRYGEYQRGEQTAGEGVE